MTTELRSDPTEARTQVIKALDTFRKTATLTVTAGELGSRLRSLHPLQGDTKLAPYNELLAAIRELRGEGILSRRVDRCDHPFIPGRTLSVALFDINHNPGQ